MNTAYSIELSAVPFKSRNQPNDLTDYLLPSLSVAPAATRLGEKLSGVTKLDTLAQHPYRVCNLIGRQGVGFLDFMH